MNLSRHLASSTARYFKKLSLQLHTAYNLNLQGSSGRDGCCAQTTQISKFDLCTAYRAYLVDNVAGWTISSKHLVHEHYGGHFTLLMFDRQLGRQLQCCVRVSHNTGVVNIGGGCVLPPLFEGGGGGMCSSKFDGELKSEHGGAWGELKMLSKNTCKGV